MQVAWTFSTGVLRGHEGSPLVIDGTMYLHSPFPNKVFAIDLETQKIIWKYEPKQDPNVIPVMCCDTVNRGVAYADGKIFLVSELGKISVLAADGTLNVLAVNDLDDVAYATPAIAGGRLYVRTRSTLYSFGLR